MSMPETKAGLTVAMNVSQPVPEGAESVEKPFGQALVEVARHRSDVVALTADLGKYTDMDLFAQEFPARFFQVGMAEQNLIGIAAGLAHTGFTAFASTYCVFASRRAYDFIAIDAGYARANVKIIAGLPGLTTGYGATHQGIDDLALMRAIPNMVVIDPCDATEIEQAVGVIAEYNGPVYMRVLRGKVQRVLDAQTYQFEIGKAKLLRTGRDVLVISTGLMTGRALEASTTLAREGIQAGILHVSTLKPFDAEAVAGAATGVPAIVIAENHTVIGGLASATERALCDARITAKIARIGIPDCFVECGSVDHLVEKYGLSAHSIADAARRLVTT
jgi:transketolase